MFERIAFNYETYKLLHEVKKICLFATWSYSENIDTPELKYIESLSKEYDLIFICTNSRNIQNVPEKCVCIQTEQNSMRDFGLWIRILLELNIPRYETIALVNDSCICVSSIHESIQQMRQSQSDLCGITNSYERSQHIQSYFLEFETPKAMSLLSTWLYTQIVPKLDLYVNADKETVINEFEIGLSKFFLMNRAKLYAVYPYTKIIKIPGILSSKQRNGNASYWYWDRLLHLGCPVLKKVRQHYPNEESFLLRYHV